ERHHASSSMFSPDTQQPAAAGSVSASRLTFASPFPTTATPATPEPRRSSLRLAQQQQQSQQQQQQQQQQHPRERRFSQSRVVASPVGSPLRCLISPAQSTQASPTQSTQAHQQHHQQQEDF